MINLIFAVSQNNIIGKNNKLPWHIPDDLKRFKDLTNNDVIVMGRKTWDSLPNNVKPLPNRINVVLTSKNDLNNSSVIISDNIENVLKHYNDRTVWVIGGTKVLQDFLPYADNLYITMVNSVVDGDTEGPLIDYDEWIIESSVDMVYNQYNYSNIIYKKVQQ
jgi:dihydrofolate reductase